MGSTEAVTPKRKRGRPRKIKLSTEAKEETKKVEKRGKKRKIETLSVNQNISKECDDFEKTNLAKVVTDSNMPSCSKDQTAEASKNVISELVDELKMCKEDILNIKKNLDEVKSSKETVKSTTVPQIIIVSTVDSSLAKKIRQCCYDKSGKGKNLLETEVKSLSVSVQKDKSSPIQIDSEPKVLKKFRPPISKFRLALENSKQTGAANPIKIKSEIDPHVKTPAIPLPLKHLNSKFHLINPWLARQKPNHCSKDSQTLLKMLTRENLICTFKCMAKCCSYATISRKNFSKHLECHQKAESFTEFLYFCPYCLFEGESILDILEHYRDHAYEKFQCGKCFYRSVSHESCWEHFKSFHLKDSESETKIYECPLESGPINKGTLSLLKSLREENVKQIVCTCKYFTFL